MLDDGLMPQQAPELRSASSISRTGHVMGRQKGTFSGKTRKFTPKWWDLSHSGTLGLLGNSHLLM